jgi:hypothetical protein
VEEALFVQILVLTFLALITTQDERLGKIMPVHGEVDEEM